MKLLITNPSAIIDSSTGKYYPGIIEVLKEFDKIEDQSVIIISLWDSSLKELRKIFGYCFKVSFKQRGGTELIELIKTQLKAEISDIFVLGCKNIDIGLSANSKLLLLRADYAKEENKKERIYTNEYGIRIANADKLKFILDKFVSIEKPWFYRCDVDKTTVMFSLTNANTMGYTRDMDAVKIAAKFQSCLKKGDESYKDEFMVYFIFSAYHLFKEIQNVDFWSIYPSSNSSSNSDLEYFKDKLRQSFGGKPLPPIFKRTKQTIKRHSLNRAERISQGCNSELDTILIDEFYRDKLVGKTICIIDDFSNIGTSCETTRNLLRGAKVGKVIFITLGKFGTEYFKYDYSFYGDAFSGFTYKLNSTSTLNGDINKSSDMSFIESLGEIIK